LDGSVSISQKVREAVVEPMPGKNIELAIRVQIDQMD
jgi:hypothetical protein